MYLIALDSIAIRCLFYLLTVRTCILRSISILRRNEILLQININLQGLELCKYHIELFLCVVFFFSWTVIQPRECNTIILYSIVQQHLKLLLLHTHARTHPPTRMQAQWESEQARIWELPLNPRTTRTYLAEMSY